MPKKQTFDVGWRFRMVGPDFDIMTTSYIIASILNIRFAVREHRYWATCHGFDGWTLQQPMALRHLECFLRPTDDIWLAADGVPTVTPHPLSLYTAEMQKASSLKHPLIPFTKWQRVRLLSTKHDLQYIYIYIYI